MNKNRIFLIAMSVISVLLFLFRVTGRPAHFAIAVVGLVVMVPLTAATRKGWKNPAPEVIMRAMYLAALVTGGPLMNNSDAPVLGIVHKVSAALFVVLLLALYLPKWKK
jgi:low affinity Fe/Cu permease